MYELQEKPGKFFVHKLFIVLGSWKTGVAHVKSDNKMGGQKTCLKGSPNAPPSQGCVL